MEQEVTTKDILEAVNTFAENVQGQLNDIKDDIGTLKSDVGTLKSDMRWVKATINTQMVTKDYLDEKLGLNKGELVVAIKNEDNKVDKTIGKLHDKKIFNKEESEELIAIKPFSRQV